MNPIEAVHLNFELCPQVIEIKVGSDETTCLSVDLVQRVSDGNLRIDVEEEYNSRIMLPPLNTMDLGNLGEVKEFLVNGIFDLSWYSTKAKRLADSAGTLLSKILSQDRRKILAFKMSNEPNIADQLGALTLGSLLNSPNLRVVTTLDLSGCSMTSIPSYRQLYHLSYLNLSGNHVENHIEEF